VGIGVLDSAESPLAGHEESVLLLLLGIGRSSVGGGYLACSDAALSCCRDAFR
jgi:hypothetical protein